MSFIVDDAGFVRISVAVGVGVGVGVAVERLLPAGAG
jgi:hypothetical protein